jgi:Pyridoxal-dependent decarboxylase, pyridoxal binding domain
MPREEHFYAVKSATQILFSSRLSLFLVATPSQIYQWRRYLPRVEPFYAVKCNPDPVFLAATSIAPRRRRLILSRRSPSTCLTSTDDRGSQCCLSSKFGAPRSKWRNSLAAVKQTGVEVVEVSFHIGSGCRDATRYQMGFLYGSTNCSNQMITSSDSADATWWLPRPPW